MSIDRSMSQLQTDAYMSLFSLISSTHSLSGHSCRSLFTCLSWVTLLVKNTLRIREATRDKKSQWMQGFSLTLNPLGPGTPIVPAGPLFPMEPAGPGRPSSPGAPLTRSKPYLDLNCGSYRYPCSYLLMLLTKGNCMPNFLFVWKHWDLPVVLACPLPPGLREYQ